MKRKRCDFKITLTTDYLSYPNQAKKYHDDLARLITSMIDLITNGRITTTVIRDCKTGRFRKL